MEYAAATTSECDEFSGAELERVSADDKLGLVQQQSELELRSWVPTARPVEPAGAMELSRSISTTTVLAGTASRWRPTRVNGRGSGLPDRSAEDQADKTEGIDRRSARLAANGSELE